MKWNMMRVQEHENCGLKLRKFYRISSSFGTLSFLVLLTLLTVYFLGQYHNEKLLSRVFLYKYKDGTEIIACKSETLVAILSLYMIAILFAEIFMFLRLPALLGILTAGLFYRLLTAHILQKPFKSYFDFEKNDTTVENIVIVAGKLSSLVCSGVTDTETSGFIRKLALGAILTRAGLSIDLKKVAANLRMTCFLSFLPCALEGLSFMAFALAIVEWPASWGALLGFVVAGVSPAIIVPNLLKLDFAGYGSDQGVASTLITASSVDDVVAILGYTISIALVTTNKTVTLGTILNILSLIPVGLATGAAGGLLLWIFPSEHMATLDEFLVLLSFEMMVFFMLGMKIFGYEGSGPIACMTCAIVGQIGWSLGFPSRLSSSTLLKPLFPLPIKSERRKTSIMYMMDDSWQNKQLKILQKAYQIMWIVLEPLLFIKIGYQVDIVGVVKGNTGNLIWVFILSLLVRFAVTVLATTKSGLSWKEKLFIGITWLPKATVPAALGSEAYGAIMMMNPTEVEKNRAEQIVSIAVLSIFIAAPLGAVLVPILGNRLLQKSEIKYKVSGNLVEQESDSSDSLLHQGLIS